MNAAEAESVIGLALTMLFVAECDAVPLMTTVPDPTLALTDADAEGIDGLGDAVQ